MTAPVIEVLGMPVRAPVTVATNLVLAAEAVWLHRRIRASTRVRRYARLWDGFVLCAGLAALLGALKHGLPPSPTGLPEAARVTSNAWMGAAVAFAQLAALERHIRGPRLRGAITVAVLVQLLLFLVVMASTSGFGVTLANAAAGLLLPLAIEWRAARRGRPGAARVAVGLAIPFGAVVLQLLEPAFGRWISHVDVEHVLLFLGLLLVQSGVTADRRRSQPDGRGEHVRPARRARRTGPVFGLTDARGGP